MSSFFVSEKSEPRIIFRFFSRFLSIFWYNLKFGSLFGSNNSEPKIIFLDFFSRFFVIFLVYSKSWLIIRFRQFGAKKISIFWYNLKIGSLFASDHFEPKIIFRFFFLDFLSFFGAIEKLAHYSRPKIIFRISFLEFFSFFLCYPKVGSLFASDNYEPKIIFEYFSLFFVNFFGVILKLAHYSVQTILTQ